MELTTVWFLLIAVLFTGYFILEGFDFGVGMLLPVLGRDDRERRVLINTIGPVWDGNEVWLITAGGALFAAFPEWYATLFSGFYLPLLAILIALILRGVAFEYRHKRPERSWKARWDAAIIVGSAVPAVLWGVAFANIVRGVPLDADHEYVGGLLDLLSPYALLGGATTAALFLSHGALFVALKTTGDIRARANRLAGRVGVVAAALAVAFLAWTLTLRSSPAAVALAAVAASALIAALAANRVRREGRAFAGTATAIGLTVAALFAALFPTVLPSTLDAAGTLTVDNAASSPYTLTIMSWVALVFTPIVLLYQGWTYWVFRRRIGVANIPD
ncbi:cytochrome bd-I ubiquinol oxidase subunit 2 apoprotein [Micromonospora pattaloongensis]|uniref:Cytochrome bd-I ubiquinol oxidase subunit 2 apoprotein n=1 Tax=Micromonospora pattaloongensis TaxID=405436 RepID=A0A1H3P3Y9_9ACTN|nr:cytochrome d ubiquinol oxidase subunit II [Micromonospora pattaloongensis]SDY95826.1 cytochrome bd-I ubiquinol oxidase subunit 2 apoprotein [Micromonospora pattaloongensis]